MNNLEEIKIIHQKVMEFTFNCDNKASFLGAIIGIMITAIASSDPFWKVVDRIVQSGQLYFSNEQNVVFDWGTFLIGLCLIISALTLFIAIILILCILLPRLGNKNGESIVFFGNIGGTSEKDYITKIDNVNEKFLLNDYSQQVHICSKICMKKFNRYRMAVLLTISSIIVFVLFMSLTIISKF